MTLFPCEVRWGAAVLAWRRWVHPIRKQQPDHFDLPILGGRMQRGEVAGLFCIDQRTGRQQVPGDLKMLLQQQRNAAA